MARKRTAPPPPPAPKQKRLSQTDVPGSGLNQALRIPRAIADHYAYEATTPLQVAKALEMQPNSGPFRQICGAAIAYGLTDGGPNANEISITALGMRIVRPLEENDDLAGKREAFGKPRVIGEFIEKYNGAPLPRHDIALNVLEGMGVPKNRTESVLALILDGAADVGFIHEIKGRQYIEIPADPKADIPEEAYDDYSGVDETDDDEAFEDSELPEDEANAIPNEIPKSRDSDSSSARRVFITHGKNKEFIDPIKKLLGFGEMIPVVSTERQSVSKPVPDKVMDDMRGCGAAIIHVDAEQKLIDQDAKEHVVINPNVLMEIGAALALYGRRFILLVREGVQLPSNLQGLYEVRYQGDSLDGDATIRLLEAINDIKNYEQPDRYHVEGDG